MTGLTPAIHRRSFVSVYRFALVMLRCSLTSGRLTSCWPPAVERFCSTLIQRYPSVGSVSFPPVAVVMVHGAIYVPGWAVSAGVGVNVNAAIVLLIALMPVSVSGAGDVRARRFRVAVASVRVVSVA